MGRGKQWSQEDLSALEAELADGRTPAAIVRDHPAWAHNTVKKMAVRFRAEGRLASPAGGRPCWLSPAQMEELAQHIEENPETCIAKVSTWIETRFGKKVPRSTVHRLMKASATPFKKVIHQRISGPSQASRLQWCTRMLGRMKMTVPIRRRTKTLPPVRLDKLWFQDEKLFRLLPKKNPQNNRVWLSNSKTKKAHLKDAKRDVLLTTTSQAEQMQGVMISLIVNARHGPRAIHAVRPNSKIDTAYFQTIMEESVYPNVLACSGPGSLVQLDNAPSHNAASTRAYMDSVASDPDVDIRVCSQPASSPDLNPLDYCYWSLIQSKIKLQPAKEALLGEIFRACDAINSEWDTHCRAITEGFEGRLKRCVAAEGGHFED